MEYSRTSSASRSSRRPAKKKPEWAEVLLFYVLPFLVFNSLLFYCVTARPKVLVELADTNDYLTTEATVTLKSWFPTKEITFSMDGETLEAEKGKGRTYTIPITKNGVIEVSVTNLNGMSALEFGHVNILDDNPPSMENTSIADGIVKLTISDSQSGVNLDSVYATDSTGQTVTPLSVDRSTATFTFEMDPQGLHIHAQDKAGNEVLGNFTSHKESGVETLQGNVEEVTPQDETAPAETSQSETSGTETSGAETSGSETSSAAALSL